MVLRIVIITPVFYVSSREVPGAPVVFSAFSIRTDSRTIDNSYRLVTTRDTAQSVQHDIVNSLHIVGISLQLESLFLPW